MQKKSEESTAVKEQPAEKTATPRDQMMEAAKNNPEIHLNMLFPPNVLGSPDPGYA